ncbi:Divergent 4Fe-4S mono-cluster [Lentzea xinjiangensis]|uniref:Divergent 4Fe-4S mono-cluster n=1 Tax=Lentzea xinjiangensis TaxID=402600 RepID=A0A1H9RTQ9_9PSEU|nr:Divergent 4Fe-4S mono-cluster [Lentzea xinjiangensis]
MSWRAAQPIQYEGDDTVGFAPHENRALRIFADTGKCVGAGQCVLTEPALFDQSEDDGTIIRSAWTITLIDGFLSAPA